MNNNTYLERTAFKIKTCGSSSIYSIVLIDNSNFKILMISVNIL